VRHPFTQPLAEDLGLMETNKYHVRTKGYDLVLNGVELGAGRSATTTWRSAEGSSRCSSTSRRRSRRASARISTRFRFGCPRTRGFAIGVDRLLALIQGQEDQRDVIAFPKNGRARISSSARRADRPGFAERDAGSWSNRLTQ